MNQLEPMNMKRRYKLFGFGVLLGVLVIYFSFPKSSKNPLYTGAWLPGKRVLEHIQSTPISMTPQISEQLICNGITNQDLLLFLKNDAEVNFSESKIRDEANPSYFLESENPQSTIKNLWVESQSKQILIKSITLDPQKKECE